MAETEQLTVEALVGVITTLQVQLEAQRAEAARERVEARLEIARLVAMVEGRNSSMRCWGTSTSWSAPSSPGYAKRPGPRSPRLPRPNRNSPHPPSRLRRRVARRAIATRTGASRCQTTWSGMSTR
jgi:hypothetical protein